MTDYMDGEGFAHYDGEMKKQATAAQIAQAKLATAVTRISARTTQLEKDSFAARSAFDAKTERAEVLAHPERLYLYVPCQTMSADSFDPTGTLTSYSRECMIFRQGDTVIMVDTGGAYSVTMLRNFLNSIGVDHVDYLIISHYHHDHSTGLSGVVGFLWDGEQNYPDSIGNYIDFSRCRVFLPIPCHAIDSRSVLTKEGDSYLLAKLDDLGIEPEYPDELDTLVVNSDLRITFFNAGMRALKEVLAVHHERSSAALDINDCSMCCLVQHGDSSIFLTGDLALNGEERLARKYRGLRARTVDVTPGQLNPLPETGDVPAGTLLRWDDGFIPQPFDGVGPMRSAESLFRKAFHADVYKIGHHAYNAAGRATSDDYYSMLNPRAAFVITLSGRDGAAAGAGHLETSASLMKCPVYSAALDDLKFVSDGTGVTCAYGSMDWTGFSRKLLHPGRFQHLYPASESTMPSGHYAVWARVRFRERQKPFSMMVHVSTLSGPDAESALIEFACVLGADGKISESDSRARIIYATDDFSGVFGMVCEGGGLVNFVVQKVSGVVWSSTILSANYLESAVLASPVYKVAYDNVDGLEAPQWYKAASASNP